VAIYGVILKHAYNMLHLMAASLRIVKLDVRQKNSAVDTAGVNNKDKKKSTANEAAVKKKK